MSGESLPRKFVIQVTGGIGSLDIDGGGKCIGLGVKMPVGSVCDVDITDVDGFGLVGSVGISGGVTIPCNAQLWGKNTIAITNATVDGTYTVKTWYE